MIGRTVLIKRVMLKQNDKHVLGNLITIQIENKLQLELEVEVEVKTKDKVEVEVGDHAIDVNKLHNPLPSRPPLPCPHPVHLSNPFSSYHFLFLLVCKYYCSLNRLIVI